MLCKNCGQLFIKEHNHQKYCSPDCRRVFNHELAIKKYKEGYRRKLSIKKNVYKQPMFRLPSGRLIALNFSPIEEPEKLKELQIKVGLSTLN